MNLLLHIKQEWDAIRKSPLTCVVCLLIGFAIGNWYYAGRLATLDSQVAFWKDKAAVAAPAATVTLLPSASAPTPPSPPSHFILNAQGASFYTSPGDTSLTGVVLDVQIRNSGPSSVATEWKLKVTPKGASPVAAQFNPIPKDLVVPGNPPVVVRASEALAKAANKPIPNGKVLSGRLLFYVSLPLAAVQNDSTLLTLSVQDIAGNEFSTAELVGNWLHPHTVPTR